MGVVLPVLGIVLIVALIGFLVYYDGYNITSPVQLNQFIEETTKFADGSFITILTENQPESQKEAPVEKKIVTDEKTGESKIVDVPVPDRIKPTKGIVQYSKSDVNGVVVQGFILLTDSTTGQVIKPYEYNALIEIACDEELNDKDGFNFCATDPVFGRVISQDGGKDEDGKDKGGFFIYKWRPSNSASLAYYDVKILIMPSVSIDHPHSQYEKEYKIQVIL